MTTKTVSVDYYRTKLLEHLEAKNDYAFCAAVPPYLTACPHDTYVRLMAVRTYLKLNLVEPAQALVQEGLGNDQGDAQLLEARTSINAVPGSRWKWAQQAAMFEANLAALTGRGVDVSPIRAAWTRDEFRYQLYRDSSGEFQVRHLLRDGDWRWYPGFGRHSVDDDNRDMPADLARDFPGPYLFDGVGLGRYFERVYTRTIRTFLDYSCALYVIERDPARFAIAFHLNDWAELLADPRVIVFTGTQALNALTQLLCDNLNYPCPVQIFQTGAVFDTPQQDTINELARVTDSRDRAIRESLAEIESRYANRDLKYWAQRFDQALHGTDKPLRILASVSRHTTFLKHSMRDAQRAFEALGHSCIVLTEDATHTIIGPPTYHTAIREIDPDLYFNLDHLRPEFGAIIPTNLPVLSWDQDQLPQVITRDVLAGIAPHDFIAGCSKIQCLALGVNPAQLLQARVPTCPAQFAGEALSQKETARFACDVSFVSHASQTPESFHQQERSQCADSTVVALLDTLYEIVPAAVEHHRVLDRYAMSEVIEKARTARGLASLDPAIDGWLRNWYLWRLADRIFRHQALEWVGQWAKRTGKKFRIYGHGWKDHPTLAEFAAGPVENGRELLCLYRATKINLQLMPAGFIHQRALDGLAAGGFFMARRVPHDFHGRSFAALDRRMRDLGIQDSKTLLVHDDAEIRNHLGLIMGPFLDGGDHDAFDVAEWIRSAAELPQPDQVFEEFENIVFDSPQQFAARADFFLQSDAAREEVAAGMRQVVVDRFSYRATVSEFLEKMCDHLVGAASKSPLESSLSPS